MAEAWSVRFRGLLADIAGRATPRHGYPLRAIEAAEVRLGVNLPAPLREYYLSVGRHKINSAHNRLLPPDALEVSQGRLVFMEENQCVVFWGVRSRKGRHRPHRFPDDGPGRRRLGCRVVLLTVPPGHAVLASGRRRTTLHRLFAPARSENCPPTYTGVVACGSHQRPVRVRARQPGELHSRRERVCCSPRRGAEPPGFPVIGFRIGSASQRGIRTPNKAVVARLSSMQLVRILP